MFIQRLWCTHAPSQSTWRERITTTVLASSHTYIHTYIHTCTHMLLEQVYTLPSHSSRSHNVVDSYNITCTCTRTCIIVKRVPISSSTRNLDQRSNIFITACYTAHTYIRIAKVCVYMYSVYTLAYLFINSLPLWFVQWSPLATGSWPVGVHQTSAGDATAVGLQGGTHILRGWVGGWRR